MTNPVNLIGVGIRKIFGTRNDRLLKNYRRNASQITALEPQIRGDYDARFAAACESLPADLPDAEREVALQKARIELSEDLRIRTEAMRRKLADGADVQSVLHEAFAVLREASRRAKNHRHFDCQLVGGQVLFEGKIAEMKTGEGKTIVCHLAAFLKCLQGKKVHIITVNDYLVERDASFALAVFELVGITVGYIQSQVDPGGREGIRRKAYACNITYGTNNEFGFDYLRDNMKVSLEEQVQGRLDFAIIDEVDSILIDEARTPLIISGPADDDVARYRTANAVAKVLIARQTAAHNETAARLKAWGDNPPREFKDHPKFEGAMRKFKVDPNWLTEDEAESIGHKQFFTVQRERKSVAVTHDGITIAQEQLGVGSLYVGANMEWPHLIENSVRAHVVYEKDVDYVVKDGEIIIVDGFTGRLMHGRQWSDGLHQSVEAKESVRVKEETQTLATITLQNFFKLYEKIAGMTGTAMTEADEFMKIYKLEVVAIPTNRPVNRQDCNDRIYKTVDDKYNAIVDEINDVHTKGRTTDPFVLAPALKKLKPIMEQMGKPTDRLDQILARWNKLGDPPGSKADRATADAWQKEHDDIVKSIVEIYDEGMGDLARGRPVLVGTISVENSEKLSNLLTRRHGIEHEVLNAKQHAREAEIVAKAGHTHESVRGKVKEQRGNVTIATNMAGRGTDIKLMQGVVFPGCIGDLGPPPNVDGRRFVWNETGVIGTKCCINCPDYDPKTNCAHCWKPKVDPRFPAIGRNVCPIVTPCGLHIVGTERHESRRIDNQLRGRAGRQGDPGSSRFFLSMGDDLLKLFMGDWMLKMMERMGFEEGMSIEAKSINRGIANAQKKVEEKNFSSRKHLLEYDEVMDHQRQVFYSQRQEILGAGRPGHSAQLVARIWKMLDATIDAAARKYLDPMFARQAICDWVRSELECTVEPKNIDVDHREGLDRYIRSAAREEAFNNIQMTVGEYMDPDADKDQWDIKGLAKWAETRFGATISQNHLKTLSQDEVKDMLVAAAEKKIDGADLAPLERFCDPHFGINSFVFWARQRFGIELPPNQFHDTSNDEAEKLMRESVHEAYRQRERSYPVEWALERTVLGQHAESAYSVDNLVQWANLKFGLNWTVDSVRARPLQEVVTELFNLNRDYLTGNRFDAEIDRAAASADLETWAKQRFGPAFDPEGYAAATDKKALLRSFGHDLIRRELTMLERYVLLQIYDQSWKEHMHAMDLLKEAIGLRSFAEQDPKIAYKREGFKMFQEMMENIQEKVTSTIFKVKLLDDAEVQSRYNATNARHAESTNLGFSGQVAADRNAAMQAQNVEQKVETIRREEPRVGRNDPCPCGSGKKYKQCHGK